MKIIDTRYGELAICDDSNDVICKHLLRYGEWAWLEVEFVSGFLPLNARVLDIGAFIGTFGLGLQQIRREIGQIVFCEANPGIFPILASNVSRLSTTTSHLVNAVAAGSSTSLLGWMPDHNLGALSFATDARGTQAVKASHETSLKELRSTFGAFDLIKIDAEGMEKDILMGDEDHLREHQPTLWLECLETHGSLHLVEWLISLGYNLRYFAFSSFNDDNFLHDHTRIFPISFEAGLLATRSQVQHFDQRLSANTFERPILNREDLREALWLTPRWGLPGWEALSAANMAAVAGRHFQRTEYSTFLSDAPKQESLAEHAGTHVPETEYQRPPTMDTDRDCEKELAVKALEAEKYHEMLAALIKGRETLITELEMLHMKNTQEFFNQTNEKALLDTTIQNLRAEVLHHVSRADEIEKKHHLLAAAKHDADTTISTQTHEIVHKNQLLEQLEAALIEAKFVHSTMKTQLDEITRSVGVLESQIQQRNYEIQEERTKSAQTHIALNERDATIEILQEKIRQQDIQLEENKAQLEISENLARHRLTEVSTLSTQLAEHISGLKQTEGKYLEAHKRSTTQGEIIKALGTQLESIRTEISERTEKISGLQSDLRKYELNISACEHELAEVKSQKERYKQQAQDLEQMLSNTSLEKIASEVTAQERELIHEREVRRLTAHIHQQGERLTALQNEYSEIQLKLNMSATEVETMRQLMQKILRENLTN